MQIVIDIPESVIEHLKDGSFGARIKDRATLVDAVMNGISLPDNATNGDVIKALFPSLNNSAIYDNGVVRIFNPLDKMADIATNTDWLYRLYKAGDTD